MKKLLLALLCGTTIVLSACVKKTNSDQVQAAVIQSYSQNNKSDIQQDLLILQNFSDLRAEQSIKLQDQFTGTLASQQSSKQALQKVEQFFLESDNELDALKIKSTEVDQRRQMLKQINRLTVQLTQESITERPDQKKMEDLHVKLQNLQQQLDVKRADLKKKLSEITS